MSVKTKANITFKTCSLNAAQDTKQERLVSFPEASTSKGQNKGRKERNVRKEGKKEKTGRMEQQKEGKK